MNHHYKGKAKYILAWLSASLLVVITLYSNAAGVNGFDFHISLTRDTIPPKKKKPGTVVPARLAPTEKNELTPKNSDIVSAVSDTTIKPLNDTILYKKSKDSLNAPVTYHADDSMILDIPGKKMILYGKVSKVNYEENELTAPVIEYNQAGNLVRAFLKKDSNGHVIAYPTFKQGDFSSKSDTIEFNPNTGKGLTKGTYTQQGEMYVYGEKIKKVDKDVFYALKARFTTCNLDTPHFAFVSNKIKFINKRTAYSGPVHPEFEGVPIPVYLPFGIFPMSQGRHSGLLAPSFTANDQQGLALEGLGYYKILNQTWDVITRGNLFLRRLDIKCESSLF